MGRVTAEQCCLCLACGACLQALGDSDMFETAAWLVLWAWKRAGRGRGVKDANVAGVTACFFYFL